MASVTTYPSHSNVPAHVAEKRLHSVLQRQQHEQSTSAPVPTFNYLIDVPISNSDISRWGTVFADAEARAREARGQTRRQQHTADAAEAHDPAAEEEEEEEGLSSYFLNADAMLNYMPSDAERKGSIYARLAPFPLFDPSAVVTLPMTKVLKFRREWLPYRQQYPLHQQRTQFLDALLNHDVVALVGAPGSGKTLQTPTVLTETEALKRRRVVLVSANVVAARLTAVRLREERGEDQQSRNVAVVVPLLNEAVPGSVIVVTTAEVLLRQLLADPLLVDVGCVIFDDVHLRTAETEVCLALLRERIAHHKMHESMKKAAAGAATADATQAAGTSTAVKRLHLFLNCPDEATATVLLDFFRANVPTTSTAYGGALGGPTTSSGSTVLLPACRAGMFVLDGTSSASGPTTHVQAGSAVAGAGLVRGSNHFVHYVEELVQWLHKCQVEGQSALCADPESDLQPHVESVDVVTRVMAAADAEFTDADKCRGYWCVLIREAVQHYTQARQRAEEAGVSTVVVVAPNTTVARLIHDNLKNSLNSRAGDEEAQERTHTTAFAFTLLDEHRTDFDTFLQIAQRKNKVPATARAHVILTTPELAQTVLPPSVPVGLLIDCARTSYRSFDINAAADQFSTEYTSTQGLRYRRAIAASAKGTSASAGGTEGSPAGKEAEEEEGQGGASSFPFSSRFMTVQLIPKSVLHSVQHRRFSADPAQQHPALRLSFERYLQLYQVLQAREEAALYARQLAVRAATASAYLPMSTVSAKTAVLLSSNLVAAPSATSGNRYEHMRRVFTLVENYLVAAGHIDVDTTDSGGAVGELYATMKPLGVLVTLLAGPLPTSVSRLLALSAIFSCAVAGTAVAAMWIVGDAFNSSINSSLLNLAASPTGGEDGEGKTPAELEEEEQELRELTKEARLFFARDSLSDVVSGFYVYKMWLSMRGGDGEEATDVMGEDEQAFLDECKVPRRLLLRIEATQARLYDVLVRSGVTGPIREDSGSLSAQVAALPDGAILDGKMQAALTGALYPNCAVMEDSRDASTSAMVLMDGLHVVSAGRSNATGITVTTKRYGVFSENSVVNDAEAATTRVMGKPFLFLDKVVGLSATGTNAAHLAVLEQAAPLQQEASIVFCGEGHVKPKPAPTRCRGWTPLLTQTWRHTRRARLLPPPAQLPTPSIPLLSYDTVKADSVILSTDDNFQFTMRATTSQWLLQLRGHIQRQLKGFLHADQHGNSTATGEAHGAGTVQAAKRFEDVAEAWDWWWRRKADGPNWLREERRVQEQRHRAEAQGVAGDEEGEGEERDDRMGEKAKNLYGFYVFTTTAGVPDQVVLPTAQPAAGKKKKEGTAAASATAQTSADATSFDAAAAAGAHSSKMYTGKRPSDDVDQVIRMCVEGIAKRRTREHEAQLLEDDPATFGFLNPENEFHEYYLYRLREAAPTLEVLGDNLEELIEYLKKLEKDLREEIGYKEPTKEEMAAEAAKQWQQQQPQSRHHQHSGGGGSGMFSERHEVDQRKQFREMAGSEVEDYYQSGVAGLQVEADASVRVKRQTGLNFAPKPSEAPTTMPTNVSAVPTPSPAAAPAAGAPAVSGQQTLLEKLMAMKNASSGGGVPPATSPVAQQTTAPTNGPAVAAEAAASTTATAATAAPPVTHPVSTQDLLATLLQSAPKAQAQPQPPQTTPGTFQPPASREELLAILTGAAPPAGQQQQPQEEPEERVVTPAPLPVPVPAPTSASAELPPQQSGPTTDELRALLGMPVPTTDASAQPQVDFSSPGASLFPTPSQGFMGMPPILGGNPMDPHNLMIPQQQQQQDYYYYYSQQGNAYEEPMQAPLRNPLTRPPPPLPAKVFDESPASVLVYPLPDKQRFGNTPLLLAKALGEELDMKVGPTTIVGRVARIAVPNSKVAARALALRKFLCCGLKVYVFKNDRIIDNPAGLGSTSGGRGRGRGRGRDPAVAPTGLGTVLSGNDNNNNNNNNTGGAYAGNGAEVSRHYQQQQDPLETQQEYLFQPYQPQEGDRAQPEEGGDEDDEDPTSTAFRQAQESLPAGITVGAFSDSDEDEE